ncbi:MAG: hypothetical protein M1817_002667 [Caeruleum heppii]|nr:MAG: hypothetical protein M1817_002667 [Caeruleum heppii]
MPPYGAHVGEEGNVTNFIDAHDVGSIPGIGFKIAQQLRHHVLGRPARFDAGLVYGGTKEHLTVGDVRMFPGIGPEVLETILSGPGAVHGIGMKIWNLLRGVDDVEVDRARSVPKQISIEDSYIRLDTIDQVRKELLTLARSLMKRMHVDLLVRCDETEGGNINADTLGADKKPRTSATEVRDQRHNEEKQVPMVERGAQRRRWRAHPRMLRLTTRPRLLRTADGSKSRTFQRTSRSGPMPSFVFSLEQSDEALAQRLVHEALLPLFRKLHPERSGWNLSLVNIAATSIVNVAGTEDDAGVARNIGSMLRNQESSLAPWKLDADSGECEQDGDAASPKRTREKSRISAVSVLEACIPSSNSPSEDHWEVDEGQGMADNVLAEIQCSLCEAFLPQFAVTAHARYHTLGE